jgi:hypothetical protein
MTGKWTAEYAMEFGVIGNVAHDIADAHNAALAAERDRVKRRDTILDGAGDQIDSLEQQLAAERKQVEFLREEILAYQYTVERMREMHETKR